MILGVVDVTKGWWSWNKFDSCFKCLCTGTDGCFILQMLLGHGFMNKPKVLWANLCANCFFIDALVKEEETHF